MSMTEPITVLQLNSRLSDAIATAPGLREVWLVAETSDLRQSGPHCYLEFIQKDDGGNTVARVRANIWASHYRLIANKFMRATGTPLASGMQIMACVTANYHPNYGMSVTVTDIDPSYTLGDAVRRRNEIVARLQAEGLMDLNRNLKWALPAVRIAVISAEGAAGYGDFINQLYSNPYRLRFVTRLFPAVMQGERTVPTVMAALDAIETRAADWDGVVIIRGGGSASDLAAFDSYDLAARIARYRLPVIVGIGHERDITVLDYVANMRVKTPTAAAEWLITRGKRVLDAFDNAANTLARVANERIAADRELLARIAVLVPGLAGGQLLNARSTLDRNALLLGNAGPRHIEPQRRRLEVLESTIVTATANALARERRRIDSLQQLADALSPRATLARGFSLTCDADGHVITDPSEVEPGRKISTRLAAGIIHSTVTSTEKN